jgi:hypothetical protein
VRKDPRGLLRVNAHDWPRTLVFPAFRPRPGGRGHRRWTQLRRGAVRQPRLRPPGFDHAVATMLNIATSLRAVQDQADPDDLDNVPVFDTASNCLDNGPIFDEERFVATGFYSNPVAIATFIHEPHDPSCVDTDFEDDPLFDEDPRDLSSAKLSILDSEFMATTTTTGVLVICSTECPSGAVNTTTLDNTVLMEIVDLPYMVFNSCYTGMKGLGCCKVSCLASGQLHIGASTDVTLSEVHT